MSMTLPGITPGGGLGAYQGQVNQNPAYMTAFNNDQSTVGNIIAKNQQTAQAATPAALTSMNTQGNTIAEEQQTATNNSTNALDTAQANEQQAIQTNEYENYAQQQAQQYAQQAQQNAESYTQSGLSNAVNGLNQSIQNSSGGVTSGGSAISGTSAAGSLVNSKQKGALNQTQYHPNGATGGGTNSADTYYWSPEAGLSSERNAIMEDAFNYIGDPYTLGGSGSAKQAAQTGIDCSGLVMSVYDAFGFGKYLNSHNAITQGQQMSAIGTRTAVSNLQAGDLVWWPSEGHIAIYAGNGMIVAAAAPGEGVKLQPVWGDAQGIALNLGAPSK